MNHEPSTLMTMTRGRGCSRAHLSSGYSGGHYCIATKMVRLFRPVDAYFGLTHSPVLKSLIPTSSSNTGMGESIHAVSTSYRTHGVMEKCVACVKVICGVPTGLLQPQFLCCDSAT